MKQLMLLALLALPAATAASALGDAAAALQPGEFVTLETLGLTKSLMTAGGCSSPVTSFSDSAVWDAKAHAFLFIGGPHGCPHVFLKYDEMSNTWVNLATFSAGKATHGYDHTTLDTGNRILYFRAHGKGGFHAYDLEAGTWQVDALPKPKSSYTQVAGGLAFFPELNRLVHINYGGRGEVDMFDEGKWRREGSASMGLYQPFVEYNPMHAVLLFGGGWVATRTYSPSLHTMDARGKIRQMNDAPLELGITATIVTVDPVSGKYLIFGNGKVFYEYDVVADTWQLIELPVPFLESHYQNRKEVVATVAAPVTTHGVVMFLQYLGNGKGGSKVWLYKHSQTAKVAEIRSGGDADR